MKATREANAIPAKYVFMDIVRFTHNRTIEAQSDIISSLNEIVVRTLKRFSIRENKRFLLPTGDGICIALLNVEIPYDIHVLIAVSILQEVKRHNQSQKDERRQFEVRIGINANTDNIITDINGHENVAGAGINVAQRVMSMADGNQVLLSAAVYDTLRFREKYFNAFHEYHATVKHGEQIAVYQLVVDGLECLNNDPPSQFVQEEENSRALPKLLAYYIAYCIQLKSFFKSLSVSTDDVQSGITWLYMLAKDAYNKDVSTSSDKVTTLTYKAESGDLRTQYFYYNKMDVRIKSQISELFINHHLQPFSELFSKNGLGEPDYRYIEPEGFKKLTEEWPEIGKRFKLRVHYQL